MSTGNINTALWKQFYGLKGPLRGDSDSTQPLPGGIEQEAAWDSGVVLVYNPTTRESGSESRVQHPYLIINSVKENVVEISRY